MKNNINIINGIGINNLQAKEVAKRLIVLLGGVTTLGYIFKLSTVFIILCNVIAGIMVPVFDKEMQKSRVEKRRYDSVITYLEQMLYSFKKKPKIREALIDAQKVCEAELKETIEEIIVNIDTKTEGDIYRESLQIIEEEYPCKRIKSVHEFIVKIEQEGGIYENYIDMLLDDIKAWNDRTRLFMNEVSRIKRNVVISIFSTMLTCMFMTMLIPADYSYTDEIIYQVSTFIMLIVMIVVYREVVRRLNFDWIKEKPGLNEEQTMRYYEILYRGFLEPDTMKGLDRSNFKSAKKRLEREIMREFPDWLREVAVNLQMETVQSAIEHSYDKAAPVLKEPIRRLLLDFEDYPIGIEPYDNFLKELDLPEVKSSMKMLYSMCELGKEESETQINSILDRNLKLEDQAEKMKNKDKIGVASFVTAIPMFIGVITIMVDMLLMILVFTSKLGQAMN